MVRCLMFDVKASQTETKAEAGDKMRSFAGSPFQKLAGLFDFCRETFLIRKGEGRKGPIKKEEL
jgi:hypothetical protein